MLVNWGSRFGLSGVPMWTLTKVYGLQKNAGTVKKIIAFLLIHFLQLRKLWLLELLI